MLKIPNFNKNEKAILEIAIEKYLEVNNLDKKTTKLTNKLIIEIVDDAHNKWEIITDKVQHKLRDSIKKKCGAIFETMEAKASRQELERVASLKEKARQMRDSIVKKHEEEMEKEIAYWGVDEKELDKVLSTESNANDVASVSSRVEIYKGTMDDSNIEGEEEIILEDDGSDFIGNISQPEEDIEIEKPIETIEKVVKEEIKEMVEEAKEEAIAEIQEVKEEVEEVIEEAKKELEIDIDEILDNL